MGSDNSMKQVGVSPISMSILLPVSVCSCLLIYQLLGPGNLPRGKAKAAGPKDVGQELKFNRIKGMECRVRYQALWTSKILKRPSPQGHKGQNPAAKPGLLQVHTSLCSCSTRLLSMQTVILLNSLL